VGRLLSGRLALILPSMAALSPDGLEVVLTEYGDGIWEWEICRQGEPLPARMRDGPFKSHDVALKAGKIALQKVLKLLEFEQQDGACERSYDPVLSSRTVRVSRYVKNSSAASAAAAVGCAIRHREINLYYCPDDCLESDTCRPFLVVSVRVSAKCFDRLWEDVSCGSFSKARSSRSSTMKP
jgi:hypothetical protein